MVAPLAIPWTLLGGLSGPVKYVSGPRGGLDGIVLSLNVYSRFEATTI